jgi:hypothetical protein
MTYHANPKLTLRQRREEMLQIEAKSTCPTAARGW